MQRSSHVSIVAIALASVTATVGADDQVRLTDGTSLSGTITKSSRGGVVIEAGGRSRKTPVTMLESVRFDGEPPQLGQARIFYNNRGYETALEKLSEASLAGIENELIVQEVAFYTAIAEARLAIAGEREAASAGRKLTAFVKTHRDSFHFYEVVEALGDLWTSLEEHDRAKKMYAVIAKAPMASLRLRANNLLAKSLQSQGKHEEAIARFDAVVEDPSKEPGVGEQQYVARLGKALSLAATDRLEAGLEQAREVIRRTGELDVALRATGYNTLGRCYEQAGRPTDALFAYLHTDLLFNTDPDSHAEALSRLATLWNEAGKPDAAADAKSRLQRRYAGTTAARRAG